MSSLIEFAVIYCLRQTVLMLSNSYILDTDCVKRLLRHLALEKLRSPVARSRCYLKFVAIPFAVEMPDWEVYQDMRQIDTREELIDAIAEYHWCPKEHDLIYDGAAEDARDCNACGREAGRGFGRLCCKVCAFHLCGACRMPQRGAPCR